jgi:hypothetical protein|nr:MAG TPA: minor capsid component [Caudoviricetes sp.]
MDDLYRDAANDANNGRVETSFTFDEKALLSAMKRIYSGKLNVSKEIEENLWRETYRILTEATDEGLSESGREIDVQFRRKVDYNNAVFSAFKVHRMQNDIATQLHDSNGDLKPFEQWKKDVEPMLDHHVGSWLKTEYDTTVIRIHQAADWQRFEENADIMPHLEWMPSTSLHPGEDHRIFWHTILPVNHTFWDRHRPGNRWNCKCWLENTDAPATEVPDSSMAKNDRPSPGLDNNPGKDGKLFSDSHPYVANCYGGAPETVKEFMEKQKNLS